MQVGQYTKLQAKRKTVFKWFREQYCAQYGLKEQTVRFLTQEMAEVSDSDTPQSLKFQDGHEVYFSTLPVPIGDCVPLNVGAQVLIDGLVDPTDFNGATVSLMCSSLRTKKVFFSFMNVWCFPWSA
jgi:hypothetical protein